MIEETSQRVVCFFFESRVLKEIDSLVHLSVSLCLFLAFNIRPALFLSSWPLIPIAYEVFGLICDLCAYFFLHIDLEKDKVRNNGCVL